MQFAKRMIVMEYRSFGRTGEKVSVIGMGTYYDPLWIFISAVTRYRRHKERSLQAIKTGLRNGINFIDTAELYYTEEMVGEAIKDFKRDELFIATKVSYPYHFSYDGIIRACEGSLRRLNTIYQQVRSGFKSGELQSCEQKDRERPASILRKRKNCSYSILSLGSWQAGKGISTD